MDRDQKFEVQYLLSISVVLVGLISSNIDLLKDGAVIGSFLFISTHLVILTLYYNIDRATEGQLNIVEKMEAFSKFTLSLSTLTFVYLIFHSISYTVLAEFATSTYGVSKQLVQSIITWGLPFLSVMLITGAFLNFISSPVQASQDISLNVVPKDLRMYPSFEENDAILVELFNRGGSEHQIELRVKLPENVIAKVNWEEYVDEYSDEIVLSEERWPLNIELGHSYEERKREIIRVTAEHEYGVLEEEVECFIRS